MSETMMGTGVETAAPIARPGDGSPGTAAALAAEALAAWGLAGARATRLASGVHDTFRIDAAVGRRYVLRLYGAGTRGVDEVLSEAMWLRSLREQGLEVPEPVPPIAGAGGVTVDDGGAARPAALYTWLPAGAEEDRPLAPDDLRRVGEVAARLHLAAERFAPPPGFRRPRYDATTLLAVPDATSAMLAESGLAAADLATVRRAAAALGEALGPAAEGGPCFGLIHGDLQATNVLARDGGWAVLDFADFGWGWYLYDAAAALLPLRARRDFARFRSAFLAGYRTVRALPEREEERLEALIAARAVYVIGWTFEHWHRPGVRASAHRLLPLLHAEAAAFLRRRSASPAAGGQPLVHLLDELRARGVRLWEEDGALRFQAPAGALDVALRAELAARKPEVLRFLARQGTGGGAPSIRRVARDGVLAPSFAQERLWILDRLQPGSGSYNLGQGIRLDGPLDTAVLRRSLSEVVRRHEALRTVLPAVEDRPVLVVRAPSLARVPLVDLAALPEPRRGGEVTRLTSREAVRGFDLAAGPLYRFALFRSGRRRHHLLLVLHHAVSDGWSSGILLREVAGLYSAFLRGAPSPLPDLPVQYADYAAWQRERLAGARAERLLAFWRDLLAEVPRRLELPTDRPRPKVLSDRGGRLELVVPAIVRRRVEELGRAAGATPFMTLLAAFQAVLAATSGQARVAVGVPVANRDLPEIEGLIGFFANTLVLPARFDGDSTFGALLAEVRETALAAYRHQELPFERLVEELRPERSAAQTPLFQVMFSLQEEAEAELEVGGLTLSFERSAKAAAKFDLSLSLAAEGGTWRGSLVFARDLFDAASARRLAGGFERMLARLAEAPERPLGELLAPERAELAAIEAWSGRRPAAPAAAVEEAFAAAVRARADAPAVVVRGSVLTFGQLAERASQLAHQLVAMGVGPETRVGLALERSVEMIVAALAVLEAGGAYLPLDPAHPEDRLRSVLAEAAPAVIVGRRAALARLSAAMPATTARSLCLDDYDDALAVARHPVDPPRASAPPEALAYTLYTSGSTGVPKGVAVSRASLARFVDSIAARYELGPGDRVLQFASVGFDVWGEEVFPTLAAGAALVLRDDAMLASGHDFLAGCRRDRVSVLNLPTSYWHHVVAALEEGAELPPTLRLVVIGSERVDPRWVARWRRVVAAPVRLLNVYGPTETTVAVTVGDLDGAGLGGCEAPIGTPLPGVRAWVVGRDRRLLAPGSVGELAIGGEPVARGYLGRPAATAEAFVPDPFGGERGARLYRTGDLVLQRDDGSLEFHGRADGQLKVRGYRLEPGEVEAALAAEPAVVEAAVAVLPWEGGPPRLVAFLVAAAELAADEVLARLRRRLPPYMVPEVLVEVAELPRTASGKVDRRALAGAPGRRLSAATSALAPRTALEEEIAGLFRTLLEVPEVGVHDGFFDRGGNSLLAVQLVSRLRRASGVELALTDVLQAPTVAALAELVEVVRQVAAPAAAGSDREEGDL